MATLFRDLTLEDRESIISLYSTQGVSRKQAQQQLADKFGVTERSIRNWARELQIGLLAKNISNGAKILIYDVETPRLRANVWWSGKQFVNGNDIIDEPKIITVAWKWFGESKVYTKTWDEDHCDKDLMEVFLKDYNEADLVIGVNNDNFDNRWINARAMKHGLHVNMFVRSLDLQKQMKRIARLPSYALKYLCKFWGVTMKLGHEGVVMWDMVQHGTPAQQKEYLKKMEVYNVGDIISTEEVYVKMIPYIAHKAHLGVVVGNGKYSCPTCGETEDITYLGDTVTAAGTIQRLMQCNIDKSQYKISNREYLNWTTETNLIF